MAAAATADCRPGRVPPWKDRRPATNDFDVGTRCAENDEPPPRRTQEALADAGNVNVEHDLRPKVAAACACADGRPVVVVDDDVVVSGADSENAMWLQLLPTPPSTDADNDGCGRRRRQYPDAAERQSRDCIGLAS